MKFLVDMGISPACAEYLRRAGYDAIHLSDEQLQQARDTEIIAKARAEARIIVTHDLDFSALMAASRERLPSIVIFRLLNMRPEHVTIYLEQIVIAHRKALEQGAVLSVTESSIRVRRLPID